MAQEQTDANLEEILLGGRAYFSRNGWNVNVKDGLADASLRLEAAKAMGDSHDISYYPALRSALQTDPDADVRAAVKEATLKLEAEFGEDECLAFNAEVKGPMRPQGGSEEAHARGDFYGADLNDFR